MATSNTAKNPPSDYALVETPVAASKAPTKRGILLVEYEVPLRALLSEVMERRGIPLWTAVNVADALDMFHEHGPSIAVVVIEQSLPEWNGPLLWQVLHRLRPSVKGCMITEDGSAPDAIDVENLGLAATFAKPLQLDDMIRVLEELTAKANAEAEV